MTDEVVMLDSVSKIYRRGRERINLRAALPGRLGRAGPSPGLAALEDCTITVRRGETLGIVGHNGAGKSTLLKLIGRVTAPTTGRLLTRGTIASLIELGVGFHPDLTGAENVRFSAAILGMDARTLNRRFDEIVDFAGIGTFIDTPVKRYSSGMVARLGFSVAAHLDADILLIDEVFGVGDVEFQRRSYERLRELRSGGAAILFVSHNLFAMSQIAKDAVCLRKGRVVDAGPVNDVITRYRTSYTAPPRARGVEKRTAYFERVNMPTSAQTSGSVRLNGTLVVDQPVRNGRVHLTIATPEGIDVLTTASEELSPLVSRQGRWNFKAVLGPLSLAPRQYRIWLSVAEDDGDLVYIHDQVSTELSVETDSPRRFDSDGVVLIPVHWEHEPARPSEAGVSDVRPREPVLP